MKKKALIVSSVASMIEQFNKDNIKILQDIGYEVDVATNFTNPGTIDKKKSDKLKKYLLSNEVKCHQINFSRNILNLRLIYKSYSELRKLSNLNKYDLVHCHSPIGGVISRFVFKNKNCKVIYTAHGFQFFEGGPKKDWLLFYPIEKILSKYTDVLITINTTDYKLAKNRFKQKEIYKIPGVGIKKPEKFTVKDKNEIRKKYNIPNDAILLTSVGELSKRKNHSVVIEAISRIKNPSIYYLVCGKGDEYDNLTNLIRNKSLEEKVYLLGYVDNIQKIFFASDICLFPSKREGLGLAGLEALSVGTPLISSNVQGITDYSKDGITGYVSEHNSVTEYESAIKKIISDDELCLEMGKNGIKISEEFFQENVNEIMQKIYLDVYTKKGLVE